MTWRTASGGLLLIVCLGVGLPISVGWWAPDWLRVAQLIKVDVRVGSTVLVSEVEDAFTVAQTSSGQVLWRLTGERIEQPSSDLYHHRVGQPRLVFRQPDASGVTPEVTLSAQVADVELPRDRKGKAAGSDYLIIRLSGAVVLTRGDLRCETEALTVRVHRKEEGRSKPDGVRLTAPGPVRIVGRPPPAKGKTKSKPRPRAEWTLEATGLAVTGSPWRAELKPPVRLRSTTLAAPELLAGQALWLEAAGGATLSQIDTAVVAGRPPEAVRLEVRQVMFTGEGETRGCAGRVVVTYGQVPASAQGALGGLAGVGESWTYGVTGLEAERLDGRLAQVKASALTGASKRAKRRVKQPLDLSVTGAQLRLTRFPSRMTLSGAPARVEDHAQGQFLEGPELAFREEPDGSQRVEGRGGVRFAAVQPAREKGKSKRKPKRAPVRWTGRAVEVAAHLASAASVAHIATASRPLRRLRVFSALGPVALRGSDGSHLTASRLSYRAVNGEGRLELAQAKGILAGIERGRRARPWRFAARTATARLDLAAVAAIRSGRSKSSGRSKRQTHGPAALRAALRAADLTGGVELSRQALPKRPERARGLAGERVTWRNGVVTAAGQARFTIGRSGLAAPTITYDLGSGRIEAGPTVRWTTSLPPRKARRGKPATTPPPFTLRGATATATLRAEPAVWKSDQLARREERRAGLPGWRIPGALERLDVVGRPLVATGPRGLRISAGRLRYAASGVELTGFRGRQVELRSLRGGLTAQRIRLMREASLMALLPGRTWVLAEGAVTASVVRKTSPLELRAGWVVAEIVDPGPTAPRGKRPSPSLGLFAAGGPRGVDLRLLPGKVGSGRKPRRRLALQTARLSGDGSRRLPSGRPGLLLEVPERWSTTVTLPKKGPARVVAGSAKAWIDVEAARAGRRKLETEEAFVRRLLASLEARGGVELVGEGLSVRGEQALLDGEQGVYVLRGKPVVVRRSGVEQRVPEWILRLSDE